MLNVTTIMVYYYYSYCCYDHYDSYDHFGYVCRLTITYRFRIMIIVYRRSGRRGSSPRRAVGSSLFYCSFGEWRSTEGVVWPQGKAASWREQPSRESSRGESQSLASPPHQTPPFKAPPASKVSRGSPQTGFSSLIGSRADAEAGRGRDGPVAVPSAANHVM